MENNAIMNKLVTKRKWIGAVLLVFLGSLFFTYQFGDNIAGALFKRNVEKYVGEIECFDSKSDLSSKGTYFRVKGYPRSLYSYSDSNVFSYQDEVNAVKINELYYEEIEELLEGYFKNQEVVFHFNSGVSYLDLIRRYQDVIDVDKDLVEQMCTSNSKEANFYISVTAVFSSKSCVDLDETSQDLYLLLRDEYAELGARVTVYLASAIDLSFFEDQPLWEYFSYADKRLTAQNACVDGKMDFLFYNASCNAISKRQPEGIMKQLTKKYEEYYGYRFNVVDYSCAEENDKAVCTYTIERVKNGLTYEGMLEYEDCGSIKDHILANKEIFAERMKMK